MTIRKATESDTERLLELLCEVLEIHHRARPDIFKSCATKYTEVELKSLLKDESRPIFVAEIDTRVVGYAFCMIKETVGDNILHDTKTLYLDDLCVDSSERGGGIGSALWEHVTSFARKIGCYNVTLNVWSGNTNAEAFYERLGLKPQKTLLEKIL